MTSGRMTVRFCEIYAIMNNGTPIFIGDELEMCEEVYCKIFERDHRIVALCLRDMGTHNLIGIVEKREVIR